MALHSEDGRGEAAERQCGSWIVERLEGGVSDLLRSQEPSAGSPRRARLHSVDRPALVLGSTQPCEAADRRAASAAGVDVTRRRSGGGAVLLEPDRQVWVDFFVPAGDALWSDDVARAAAWAGELWASVVACFVPDAPSVFSGRLVADEWGRLVCFAGAGPGEVFAGGLKLVGISQRRSRRRARIQTLARLDPVPAPTPPPGARLPGPQPPGPQPPGPQPPGPQIPGAQLPGPQIPGAQLPGPQIPGAQLPGPQPPDSEPSCRIAGCGRASEPDFLTLTARQRTEAIAALSARGGAIPAAALTVTEALLSALEAHRPSG